MERPPRMILSPSSAGEKGSSMFSVSMRWRQGEPLGDGGSGELDALVGGVDEEEEAVVEDGLAVVVGDLKGLAVEHHAEGAVPLGVPGLVGEELAVGGVPGDVADDPGGAGSAGLRDAADDAVLEELAAVEVGVLAAQMDEAAR